MGMTDGQNTVFLENSGMPPPNVENHLINPIEQSLQFAEERKYFDAFTTWFQATPEDRDEAIHSTWMNMTATGNLTLRDAMKEPSLSNADRFISRNLAFLISLTGERLFGPSNQLQLTAAELNGFYEYPLKEDIRVFQRKTGALVEGAKISPNTTRSFSLIVNEFNRKWNTNLTPGNTEIANRAIVHLSEDTVKNNFTEEEMARFLKQAISRIKRDGVLDSEIGEYFRVGLVNLTRHKFLYNDPELGKYFPPDSLSSI